MLTSRQYLHSGHSSRVGGHPRLAANQANTSIIRPSQHIATPTIKLDLNGKII